MIVAIEFKAYTSGLWSVQIWGETFNDEWYDET